MQCSKCRGRLRVVQTVPRAPEVWRRYRCPDCDTRAFTVERTEPAWPKGLGSGHAKLLARGPAPIKDTFAPDAGADLAAIWGAVVRPQQRDPI